MTKLYISVEECTSLAFELLKKVDVYVTDEDVEDLAEDIKNAADNWFKNAKDLRPKYRYLR